MREPIEAVIHVRIEHRGGPEITDPGRVLAWLTPETLNVNETTSEITFSACSTCSNPDECDCTDAGTSFRLWIDSADLA